MRRGIALAIAVFSLLAAALAATGTYSASGSASASTTVSLYIDISHIGTIGFGAVDPGSSDNPNTTTFYMVIENTTNVDTNLSVRADAYFFGNTPATSEYNFSTGNMSYSSTSSAASAVNFSTNYTSGAIRDALGWTAVAAPTTVGYEQTLPVWFWIDIPVGQRAATYNTSITFRISEFQ